MVIFEPPEMLIAVGIADTAVDESEFPTALTALMRT